MRFRVNLGRFLVRLGRFILLISELKAGALAVLFLEISKTDGERSALLTPSGLNASNYLYGLTYWVARFFSIVSVTSLRVARDCGMDTQLILVFLTNSAH